jgi:SnoaL-like domain
VNDVEKLMALEEIRYLKARYFRCVDTKDWDGFAAVFADDVQFDITDDVPGCILGSPGAIVEMTRQGLQGCVSVHHGHGPEITITSDTTATGVWPMEDMLRWAPESGAPIQTLHGYGHYHETYRRIDGRWRIQTLKLARLRVDVGAWDATPEPAKP